MKTLRSKVRAIIAAHIRSLIPVQPQPFQPFHDIFHRALHFAGDIGILNTEDEGAAGVPGKQPVEHGCSDTTHVWSAGGAGCKADPDRCGHSEPFSRIYSSPFYHPIEANFYAYNNFYRKRIECGQL